MSEHRYILEKSSKKHLCPDCSKRRFVPYIDTQMGEYLPEQYGRCDRESKCSYHLNPYSDGYAKMIRDQEQGRQTSWKPQPLERVKKELPKPVFIPDEILSQTRGGYEQNIFIQNLLTNVAFPFEVQDIERVISHYHLGTVQNGYRAGATTFPYIDKSGNVRAIQVKQFDKDNHTTGTDFLHSIIEKHHTRNNEPLPEWIEPYNNNYLKVSCLFGEQLLSKYPCNPIALVEAPKTAVYGTLYNGFPEQPKDLLWLAVFNLSSLNFEKCRALQGRDVFLFPDLSKDGKAFELWSKKAEEIQKQLPNTRFRVSDLLEQLAPEKDKADGKDIADYLITQDWRLFRKQELKGTPPPEPQPIEPLVNKDIQVVEVLPLLNEKVKFVSLELPEPKESKDWTNEISDLESFFSTATIPQNIKLDKCTTVTNVRRTIESHFTTVKANNGKRAFRPYIDRLLTLKELVQPTPFVISMK
jgi:hypothetical protein